MKRLLFFVVIGALVAWLADPTSGAQRRERLLGAVQRGPSGPTR